MYYSQVTGVIKGLFSEGLWRLITMGQTRRFNSKNVMEREYLCDLGIDGVM